MPHNAPQPAPEYDPDSIPAREVEFPSEGNAPPSKHTEIPLPRRESIPEYPEVPEPNREPKPASSYTEKQLINLRPPRLEELATHRAQKEYSIGSGPHFGGFRPILRLPDTQEGLVTLLFLERRGHLSGPETSDTASQANDGRFLDPFESHHRITPRQATALAEGTFPRGTPGYFLAEDLAMAILTDRLDLFTEKDRTRYALLYAQQVFADDPVGIANCQDWILGRTTSEKETQFIHALLERGFLLHEVLPGKLWVQSSQNPHLSRLR